jgi:arylsulfatase A-like enzyme/Tfp pilus assembly protein PilF
MMKRPSCHAFVFASLLVVTAMAALVLLNGDAPPPDLLLITLDTVRADHLGAYGDKDARTPALDRLAREGVRFADASTHAPLTGPAHAGILTGVYPARFGIRDNAATVLPADVPTLASTLGRAGYRTGAFISAFILDRAYGFDRGFDEFDSHFDRFEAGDKLQAQRTADQVLGPALAWLSKLPPDRPFFAWVHLYDAHAPYSPPEPYRTEFRTHPYDGEIAYVDSAVGRLVLALQQKGVLDRTLVVAIGDHGESLGEHGEEEHGLFLYDAVLRVPLIMRLPGRAHAGLVVGEQVRAIDLLPTILAVLGVPSPPRLDGVSLVPVIAGTHRDVTPPAYAETYYPQLHFGWSALESVRVPGWKYVNAPKPEIYDLRGDPSERTNVIDRQANVAGRLGSDLRQIASALGAAPTNAAMPDADTLARLRSLGYVGFTGGTPAGGGPDPKDMVARLMTFRHLLADATGALRRRQPGVAVEKLKQALAIDQRAYDVHLLLADAYAEQHEYRAAVGEYEAAALLNPMSADPLVAAANVLVDAGQVDQARRKIDDAARLAPGSADVALARGRLDERQGLFPKALDDYREAVKRNPSDPRARSRIVSVALQIEQFDVADAQLKALLEAGFEPARTHYGLGVVAESRGDRGTAAREYRRALTIDATLTAARQALARVQRGG